MTSICITGTGTGIGYASALYFGRKGYTVFAGVRDIDRATDFRQRIEREALPIQLLALDVNETDSVTAAVARIRREVGGLDVLVNNAGILGGGALEETSLEVATALFNTNYFGAIRMMQAVLPDMRERQQGCIVNVTSLAGRLAMAGYGHYGAAKHALEAASEILAQEVRMFNIRVALVAPGVVLTPIFTKPRPVPPLTSPYNMHTERVGAFFAKQLRTPTLPDQVAAVIEHAIRTDHPQLRYLVGRDAEALMRGRQTLSDEAWVDLGREMSYSEYARQMNQIMDAELF